MNRHESQRGYFAHSLYQWMKDDKTVWLICPDLGYAMWDTHFAEFPDRCINVGASEQSALGLAVGLAQEKQKPFVYSITPFLLSRGHEWIRNYIDHEQAPVRMVGSGRDLDYAHDGWTHHATDARDILIPFREIETYFPRDKIEIPDMVHDMVIRDKPCFISLKR